MEWGDGEGGEKEGRRRKGDGRGEGGEMEGEEKLGSELDSKGVKNYIKNYGFYIIQ